MLRVFVYIIPKQTHAITTLKTNIKLNLIDWNLKNSGYVGHTLKQNIPDEIINNTDPFSKFTTYNLFGKHTSTFD